MDNTHDASSTTQPAQYEANARQKVDFGKLNQEMKFFPSTEFVLTAATVTFKGTDPLLHVLLVHNTNPKYDETFFTLPGGRKNIGETLESAAIRETLEETGYQVGVPSASIPTRATRTRRSEEAEELRREWQPRQLPLPDDPPVSTGIPSARHAFLAQGTPAPPPTTSGVIDDCSKEPVGLIMYGDPLVGEGANCTKLRFFFYATLVDAGRAPDTPTPDHGEHLQAIWVTVPEALDFLRFEAEREALRTAHALHISSGCGTRRA